MTADGALDATQAQPIAEPEVPPVADDATTERSRAAPAATSPQPRHRRERRSRGWTQGRVAVSLSIVLVLTLALAAVIRVGVVRAVPEAAGLYAAFGFPVNLRGLELRGVKAELSPSPSGGVLLVEGEIVNATAREVAVPPLELAVRDAAGHVLYTWTSDVAQKTLDVAEAAPFRAKLSAPPSESRQVLVRFAVPSEHAIVAAKAP